MIIISFINETFSPCLDRFVSFWGLEFDKKLSFKYIPKRVAGDGIPNLQKFREFLLIYTQLSIPKVFTGCLEEFHRKSKFLREFILDFTRKKDLTSKIYLDIPSEIPSAISPAFSLEVLMDFFPRFFF